MPFGTDGPLCFGPSVDRRIAQPSRFKKDRSGQQPVNSGQKRRIENLDNLAWRIGGERQAGRTSDALPPRSRFDIDSAAPKFVRRALGPATKGVAEGG